MGTSRLASIGPIATDVPDAVLPVLQRAWEAPFTTRSDYARTQIEHVAIAACLGLLTVRHDHNDWGRCWKITSAGLQLLENIQ